MKRIVLPPLDKNYILSHIDQEDIFSRYFGIARYKIDESIKTNTLVNNPNRKDTSPSLGFKWSGNKLKCRDFSGYFWGDCFDAVAHTIRCNTHTPEDFKRVIDEVAREFKIHRYTLDNRPPLKKRIEQVHYEPPTFKVISVAARDWNMLDVNYWMQIGADRARMKKFYVIPCAAIWINNLCIYEYDQADPAYGYYLGRDDNQRELWQIYFPFRSKEHKYGRFISNCYMMKGMLQMTNAEYGVIIKAYKDVICLDKWSSKYSMTCIAPHSEGNILTENEMKFVRSKARTIITVSDFDRTGILFGLRMQRTYGTLPLYFTNGNYGTIDFQAKDLAEYYPKFGYDQTDKLIDYFFEVIQHPELLNDYGYIITELNHNFKQHFQTPF